MKLFKLILLFYMCGANASIKCNIISEIQDLSPTKRLRPVEELVKIPMSSNSITSEYINALNHYIKLYKLDHRDEVFHARVQRVLKRLKGLPEGKRNQRIINLYSQYKHYDKDIYNLFLNLVKKKHVESLYCIGRIYEYGIGVEVNYIEAWAWYNTAFAVEGLNAKNDLDRVWQHLDSSDLLEGQRLSDLYTYKYTDITSTPSITILR